MSAEFVTTNLDPHHALWRSDDLHTVEAIMHSLAAGPSPDGPGRILQEHLGTGGKRLRARLALGSAEALGMPRSTVVAWAAACELLHNATLIHDDLQDGDRVRRGKPTVWVAHGTAQAITAGDLGLMLPYRAVEQVQVPDDRRWLLARAIARGAEQVARGQANEAHLLRDGLPTWTDYMQVIEGKTAALFSLPVEGSALIAGCTADEAEGLAAPFRAIGALFQIQDDLLDLYGDKGRDAPGSDLREGKVSALVVEHLRLHDSRAWLLDLLALPRDQTTAAAVAEATQRLHESGALAAVWQRVSALGDAIEGHQALARYPKLHRAAIELVAMAMAPVAHIAPMLGSP